MLTPIHILSEMVIPRFLLTERFPKFGCEGNNQREFVCDADAESLCLSDIWPHWYEVISALNEICPCQFWPINLVNQNFNYIYIDYILLKYIKMINRVIMRKKSVNRLTLQTIKTRKRLDWYQTSK